MQTAVLYCVFNRLDVVKQTFEPIKRAKPPRLYISCDGPRKDRESDYTLVKSVQQYILDNIDWPCVVKTLFRDENLGCSKAIPSAIDWLFENEETGIILEDDILAGDDFFNFCEKMLIKYKDDEHVRSICPLAINTRVESENDYTFTPLSNIWGWAGYRRTWQSIDFDTKTKVKECLKNKFFHKIFRREEEILYWTHMLKVYSFVYGFTWAYTYAFNNLLHVPKGCYSISTTNKNLVTNIGYEGAHYDKKTSKKLGWAIDKIDTENLKGPDSVELDYNYLDKCATCSFQPEVDSYVSKNFIQRAGLFAKCYIGIAGCFLKMLYALSPDARRRRYGRLLEAKYCLDKLFIAAKLAKEQN